MTSLLCLILLFLSINSTRAQSTADLQLPPLQWINLSPRTRGSRPPPLRDPAVAYDPNSRTLVLFGGQSTSQTVTQQTFILDLATLTWSISSPTVPSLSSTPPARSKAFTAVDFAANLRRSFLIFGGMGENATPMNDLWSYSFADQFWYQINVTGSRPTPRWSSMGGSDPTQSIRNPNPPDFKNTVHLFGGSNATHALSLSDAWRLTVDGAISGNIQTVAAQWENIQWSESLPLKSGAASAVLPSNTVVIYGGCTDLPDDASCAGQDAYIMHTSSGITTPAPPCPAARVGGLLVPNYNTFSSSYQSQVFLFLGAHGQGWDVEDGEVAVLDTSSSLWTKVIPAGDPSATSNGSRFPSPRQGAAVVAFPSGLVGDSRDAHSDILVFGGQDSKTGEILDEIWLLRSYNGSTDRSHLRWSGYGDGVLKGGVDADGQGVEVAFLSQCSSPRDANPSDPSSQLPPSDHTQNISQKASIVHKTLLPIALALFVASYLVFRPLIGETWSPYSRKSRPIIILSICLVISSLACYLTGVIMVGRTITTHAKKRSLAHSRHGLAGLTLGILLYGSFLAYSVHTAFKLLLVARRGQKVGSSSRRRVIDSMDSSSDSPSTETPPSLRASSTFPLHGTPRRSSQSVEVKTPDSRGGFEVLNRPRHTSHPGENPRPHRPSDPNSSRELADIDWLMKRRSLHTVGELDYTLSQNRRNSQPTIPPPTLGHDELSNVRPTPPPVQPTSTQTSKLQSRPPSWTLLLRVTFHAVLFANVVFCLLSLWNLGNKAPFSIFLALSVGIYALMAWSFYSGQPRNSLIALIRAKHTYRQAGAGSGFTLAVPDPHPYSLSPPPRFAPQVVETSQVNAPIPFPTLGSLNLTRTVREEMLDEDNEDDDEKQERIEREMQRRDVSIVTVPRRSLRIANISTP